MSEYGALYRPDKLPVLCILSSPLPEPAEELDSELDVGPRSG